MERKIGEKFEYEPGMWLEVAPQCFCEDCFFDGMRCDIARTGSCSISGRTDSTPVIFRPCDPPAPGWTGLVITPDGCYPADLTNSKPSEATFEFSAVLHEIKTAPPPSEWMRGMTEAWQNELIEAARDAFVYRFWDMPNTSLAAVMGVSEATVRRIRKKRLRKNREQE